MLATLFLAPGLTNVEMRPTRVVGRGEQAYDYDNRGQVCFRLYCPWVGLSCLAVFLVATLWRSAHRLCPWQWCRCCWSRDGEDKKPTWCSERPKQLVLYRRRTHMGVSENSGTPKSSISIGFSLINHPFWGTTIFGNIHMVNPTINKFPDLIWDWDVQMVSICINCSDGHRDPAPHWPIICLVIAILECWKDWSRSSNTFMVQERRDWWKMWTQIPQSPKASRS